MALDRSQLDTLISTLETGAAALATATDANTAAQTSAATAKGTLDSAQAANTANVASLKTFVVALDADGNDPAAPVVVPIVSPADPGASS